MIFAVAAFLDYEVFNNQLLGAATIGRGKAVILAGLSALVGVPLTYYMLPLGERIAASVAK